MSHSCEILLEDPPLGFKLGLVVNTMWYYYYYYYYHFYYHFFNNYYCCYYCCYCYYNYNYHCYVVGQGPVDKIQLSKRSVQTLLLFVHTASVQTAKRLTRSEPMCKYWGSQKL